MNEDYREFLAELVKAEAHCFVASLLAESLMFHTVDLDYELA